MRYAIEKMVLWGCAAITVVLAGCGGGEVRIAVEPYSPHTPLLVIERFLKENPVEHTNVTLYVSACPPGGKPRKIGPVEDEVKHRIIEALKNDTRPVDTGGTSVVGLASVGGIELDGPLYSIHIVISSIGFNIGGTMMYAFANPLLAVVLRDEFRREKAIKGRQGEDLVWALGVGSGANW